MFICYEVVFLLECCFYVLPIMLQIKLPILADLSDIARCYKWELWISHRCLYVMR
jgi:hypothetical protein